jgi:hypothetical protein
LLSHGIQRKLKSDAVISVIPRQAPDSSGLSGANFSATVS